MNKLINGTRVPIATTLVDHMADFLNNIAKYYQDKKITPPIGMVTGLAKAVLAGLELLEPGEVSPNKKGDI